MAAIQKAISVGNDWCRLKVSARIMWPLYIKGPPLIGFTVVKTSETVVRSPCYATVLSPLQ